MSSRKSRYIVSAILGGVVFVLVGYAVYNLPNDSTGGRSFEGWLSSPLRYGAFWWGAFGALFGIGAKFASERD